MIPSGIGTFHGELCVVHWCVKTTTVTPKDTVLLLPINNALNNALGLTINMPKGYCLVIAY